MPIGRETPVQVLKKEEKKNEDSFFLPQADVPVPPAQGMTIIFLSSSKQISDFHQQMKGSGSGLMGRLSGTMSPSTFYGRRPLRLALRVHYQFFSLRSSGWLTLTSGGWSRRWG